MMDRRQLDAFNSRSLPQNCKAFPFQNRLRSRFAVFVGPSAPRPPVSTQKAEAPSRRRILPTPTTESSPRTEGEGVPQVSPEEAAHSHHLVTADCWVTKPWKVIRLMFLGWLPRKILKANCCGGKKTVLVPRSSGGQERGGVPVLPKKVSTVFIPFLGQHPGGSPSPFQASVPCRGL